MLARVVAAAVVGLCFVTPSAQAQDGGLDAAVETDAAFDAAISDTGPPDAPSPREATPSPDGLGFCCTAGGSCDHAFLGGFSETGTDCERRFAFDANPLDYTTTVDEHGCPVLHTGTAHSCFPPPPSLDAGNRAVGPPAPTREGSGCAAGRRVASPPWLVVALGAACARRGNARRRA